MNPAKRSGYGSGSATLGKGDIFQKVLGIEKKKYGIKKRFSAH
jgi:hypothetical protein